MLRLLTSHLVRSGAFGLLLQPIPQRVYRIEDDRADSHVRYIVETGPCVQRSLADAEGLGCIANP